MSLSECCLVIDIDGFKINDKFHPREYGYASLTSNANDSFRFNLYPFVKEMSDKDWKTAVYCTNNVHGLSLRPRPDERDLLNENILPKIILLTYERNKTFDKKIVAYKGGQIEKTYLDKLKIASLDLEKYGCPKYCNLPMPNIKDCGYHKKMKSVHCPKAECFAFAKWVRENL